MEKNKLWGLIAAVAYLLLWLGLMYWIRFPVREVVPVEQGLLIDFGQEPIAGGEQDTPLSDETSTETAPPQPPVDPVPPTSGDVAVEEPPVEQPQRRSDPRALFPGRTPGSTSASQGATEGAGNQGSAAGMPDGTSYALTGRSLVGALPKPAYSSRREGRVVVEIVVDPQGQVVSAAYRATGSTGVDGAMIEDALAAARKARFNVIESENNQQGTIVYIFTIN